MSATTQELAAEHRVEYFVKDVCSLARQDDGEIVPPASEGRLVPAEHGYAP
jgi:hypothetical protein